MSTAQTRQPPATATRLARQPQTATGGLLAATYHGPHLAGLETVEAADTDHIRNILDSGGVVLTPTAQHHPAPPTRPCADCGRPVIPATTLDGHRLTLEAEANPHGPVEVLAPAATGGVLASVHANRPPPGVTWHGPRHRPHPQPCSPSRPASQPGR